MKIKLIQTQTQEPDAEVLKIEEKIIKLLEKLPELSQKEIIKSLILRFGYNHYLSDYFE